MAKSSSVSITVSKAQPVAGQNAANNASQKVAITPNVLAHEKATSLLPALIKPDSKDALIALYHQQPLPINNVVSTKELTLVNEQRLALYAQQEQRTAFFYRAPPSVRPTYLAQELKTSFLEYTHFQKVQALDKRALIDLEKPKKMWQQIHIIDDLVSDIVRRMPAQKPAGWQLTSGSKNHLKLPTVGRLRDTEAIADQASINSYVLAHFGVMSYTFDRAFYIGHIVGYLFCCYYFAHLSIAYGVTPLPNKAVADYDYASLETAKVVRLLQSLDEQCKRRIYQLAIYCARISSYKMDKYVEKLLITEVNEFDKKQQILHLDMLLSHGLMPSKTTGYADKDD